MEVNFSEKSVLVTGAGGSIGRVLVNSLMKNGATVSAVDSSDKSLKNLEAEIGGNGKLQTILSITKRFSKSSFFTFYQFFFEFFL